MCTRGEVGPEGGRQGDDSCGYSQVQLWGGLRMPSKSQWAPNASWGVGMASRGRSGSGLGL